MLCSMASHIRKCSVQRGFMNACFLCWSHTGCLAETGSVLWAVMFQFDQKLCGSGSTRRGFTAMALYHKPLGRLSRAQEPERWQRLSPVEHLHVRHAGPRKSLCHWWNSASNVPLQRLTEQLKDNLLVKADNLYVFIQVILLSLMSSPTYSLRIIPLSELWRDFPWHLNWKECLQPIHQKNVVEKLNLATGKTRQSDNLNVL